MDICVIKKKLSWNVTYPLTLQVSLSISWLMQVYHLHICKLHIYKLYIYKWHIFNLWIYQLHIYVLYICNSHIYNFCLCYRLCVPIPDHFCQPVFWASCFITFYKIPILFWIYHEKKEKHSFLKKRYAEVVCLIKPLSEFDYKILVLQNGEIRVFWHIIGDKLSLFCFAFYLLILCTKSNLKSSRLQ